MSMSQAFIKDALRRIESKLDRLLEGKQPAPVNPPEGVVPPMTEMQAKMARVRAGIGKNTGEEGRG